MLLRQKAVSTTFYLSKAVIPFLVFLICVSAFGQRPVDTINTVRLNPKTPSIFLEFVRTGNCSHAPTFSVLSEKPCESKRTDITLEKYEAVWLRLVNNTRWAIVVSAKNILPTVTGPFRLANKNIVSAAADGAEIDLHYNVEAETGCDFHKAGPNGEPCKQIDVIAPKIKSFGVSTPIFIPSGKSVVFAVNRDYLKEYLMVYVLFHYEWETNDVAPSLGDPKHRVYFSWATLEKALKK